MTYGDTLDSSHQGNLISNLLIKAEVFILLYPFYK